MVVAPDKESQRLKQSRNGKELRSCSEPPWSASPSGELPFYRKHAVKMCRYGTRFSRCSMLTIPVVIFGNNPLGLSLQKTPKVDPSVLIS